MTFWSIDILNRWRFDQLTFQTDDVSINWQKIDWLTNDVSIMWQLTNDVSINWQMTFRSIDISNRWHFKQMTFRSIDRKLINKWRFDYVTIDKWRFNQLTNDVLINWHFKQMTFRLSNFSMNWFIIDELTFRTNDE